MDKKTLGIIIAIVAVFAMIVGLNWNRTNYGRYDRTRFIAADNINGNYPDMVIGDIEKAKVVIVEYGDYQCTACAPMAPYIEELVDSYKGEVAVIFRHMIMDYHNNGTAAASAALAAYEQGYWREYKTRLFANQADWYYSNADTRQTQFEEYFMAVTDNKGDLEKFRQDMGSSSVTRKLKFDQALATLEKVEWTPYFLIDGELISNYEVPTDTFLKNLRAKIDEKLKKEEK